MGMTEFIVSALPAGEADGAAPAGRRLLAEGPSPCRRCLRRAEVGDPLLLLTYNPFTVPSPYAGEGPVFVHADGCEPRSCAPGEVPDQVAESMLSVRAYDEQAMMVGAEVLTGARLAERARALLRPGVAFLHVHFAGPGCFAFRVDPA